MVEKYKLFTGLFFGALWTLLTMGFIMEELIPPLASLRSVLTMLCDCIFLVLGLYCLRTKRDCWIAVTFVLLAVITSWLNHLGIIFVLNGSRDFFGLIFAIPICRFLLNSSNRDRFIESFDKQLFYFLILQAFCVTWQFFRYGANDHGGGSMGFGYSGIVSTMIYIISFYLLSKKWRFGNYWSELLQNKIYILLLFPTFLNETKISFIFFLAYFLLLLPVELKTVFKVLISIPLLVVLMVGVGFSYLAATNQSFEKVFSQSAMDDYMIGEDPDEFIENAMAVQEEIYYREDMGLLDIPRFTKIIFIPEALKDAPGGFLFGAGLGQFKGGTTLELTPYADTWQWLLSGSVPYLFFIIIQLGLAGVVWLLFDLVTLLRPRSTQLLGINIKLFVCLIIGLVFFYNDSLRYFPLCTVLFYIILLGYPTRRELVADREV